MGGFLASGPGVTPERFGTAHEAWQYLTRERMRAEDAEGNVRGYDGTRYSLTAWDLDHAPNPTCGHDLSEDGTGQIEDYRVQVGQ